MLNRVDLDSIHRYSDHHRDLIELSDRAGCFHCGAIFAPSEIRDWLGGRQGEGGRPADADTALCPRCGVDAVLPSGAPILFSADLLAAMRAHFFEAAVGDENTVMTERGGWLRHPVWIPIAWLLCAVNVAGVWFAARPAEPWHATIHAVLAVLFALGATRKRD